MMMMMTHVGIRTAFQAMALMATAQHDVRAAHELGACMDPATATTRQDNSCDSMFQLCSTCPVWRRAGGAQAPVRHLASNGSQDARITT